MADLIDPDKLVSLPQLAKEYGYNPNYLSNLAAQKKFKAWHVGNSWITTREFLIEYLKKKQNVGRPRKTKK